MTCMIVSGYSLQSGHRHLLLECGLSGWVYDAYKEDVCLGKTVS